MSLKPIRAIAFDLDGTLIDSVPALATAASSALVDLGFSPCSLEAARGWIGNGAETLMRRALSNKVEPDPGLKAELVDAALERFHFHYASHLDQGSPLYPGVSKTIEALAHRGYRLALITNKPSRYVPSLMQTVGLASYFDLMLGGDSLKRRKPDPMPIYHVLAEFGLSAPELLMVGDSRNDIFAAQAASCPCVGVTYGYNYGEDIRDLAPDFAIDDFDSLLALLPSLTEKASQ